MLDKLNDTALVTAAFMAAPVSMMILNQSQIIKVNKETKRLFGWEGDDDELEGQSIRVLYPPIVDYIKAGECNSQRFGHNARLEEQCLMHHRNGSSIWVHLVGLSLTPATPFELMIWLCEKVKNYDVSAIALTLREREILNHLIKGQTSKVIAQMLGISPRTVEVHRASIMRKFEVHNIAELVNKVLTVR